MVAQCDIVRLNDQILKVFKGFCHPCPSIRSPQNMDFAPLRNYLGGPVRPTSRDVMMDAVVFRVPGPVMLLRLLLEMRVIQALKHIRQACMKELSTMN